MGELTYGRSPGSHPYTESRRNNSGVLRRGEDLSAAASRPDFSAIGSDSHSTASFVAASWTDVPDSGRNVSRFASRVRLSGGFGRFSHRTAGICRNLSSVPQLEAGQTASLAFQCLWHARFSF